MCCGRQVLPSLLSSLLLYRDLPLQSSWFIQIFTEHQVCSGAGDRAVTRRGTAVGEAGENEHGRRVFESDGDWCHGEGPRRTRSVGGMLPYRDGGVCGETCGRKGGWQVVQWRGRSLEATVCAGLKQVQNRVPGFLGEFSLICLDMKAGAWTGGEGVDR